MGGNLEVLGRFSTDEKFDFRIVTNTHHNSTSYMFSYHEKSKLEAKIRSIFCSRKKKVGLFKKVSRLIVWCIEVSIRAYEYQLASFL